MLRIYFQDWLGSQQSNQGRLLAIIMQWKEAKMQQMLTKCLFQGWKRVAQEAKLVQTQTEFTALKKGASEEAGTLKHMLDKTKSRLDVANEIGANRAATLTRVLAQVRARYM